MNEEKKYLIFMIINIIITLIIGIRTFSKMSNNGCITPQSLVQINLIAQLVKMDTIIVNM